MASQALPRPRGPMLTRLQPTVPVGQPMPPMQRIPEPVDMVGRFSGRPYGALGDNPSGPEMVHVVPPGPATNPTVSPLTGETSFDNGGMFSVGPSAGSPDTGSGYMPSQPDYGGQGSPDPVQTYGGYTNQISPPGGYGQSSQSVPGDYFGYGQSSQSSYSPNINSYGGVGDQAYGPAGSQYPRYPGDPVAALYNARQAQLQSQYGALGSRANYLYAQQGALGGQNNVLNATAATFPYQTAARQAQGQSLAAQGTQNQLQRGYLQQQGQNEQQRLGELAGIYAASQNVPDILRAGEAQQAYNAENQRDQRLGVSAPVDVVLPPGASSSQPGVRGAIQTQEQALTRQAGFQDPIRNAQLALAQNAVSLQGTDVEQARLAAQQAGLTLDQANQMVSEARNQAGYSQLASQGAGIQSQFADLGTTAAGLNVAQAQMPPAPGMVPSPYPDANGQYSWMTPQEAEDARILHVYGPEGILSQRYAAGETAGQVRAATTGGQTLARVLSDFRTKKLDRATAIQELQRVDPTMSEADINTLLDQALLRGAAGLGQGSLAIDPNTGQLAQP